MVQRLIVWGRTYSYIRTGLGSYEIRVDKSRAWYYRCINQSDIVARDMKPETLKKDKVILYAEVYFGRPSFPARLYSDKVLSFGDRTFKFLNPL